MAEDINEYKKEEQSGGGGLSPSLFMWRVNSERLWDGFSDDHL